MVPLLLTSKTSSEFFQFSCKTSAPSLIASSAFVTEFKTSYSTSIKSSNSSASSTDFEATANIGCPLYKTLSEAKTFVILTCPYKGSFVVSGDFARSSEVTIALQFG